MKIRWRFSFKCGKRGFASELDAQLALVRSHRRARLGKDTRAKLEIRHYRCPRCDRWHLTSEPKRAKAPRS